MSVDKDVARAYSAFRNPRPALGVRVLLEGGVPLYLVPRAVSGRELPKLACLRRPKPQGWKVFF